MASDDAFEAWRRRAADAKILDVAQGGDVKAKLTKKSREWVGACPLCGGGSDIKGKKRKPDGFAVNPVKGIFNCRRGGAGGDVISMVMHTCSVSFLQACEIITGEPPPARGSTITEETRKKSEELRAEAEERERRRRDDDNFYRAREIRTVREIYERAHPFAGSSAEIYAGIRGLVFPPVPADRREPIKCVEAMPYHVDKDTIVHRGPAMVAPIINANREFQGLHFTYLDLDREKGKLVLDHDGDLLDAKKSRGSKQGNYIALSGPVAPTILVLGEAIEKTIAVYMALDARGQDLSEAAFWSACDLGNLAGKAVATVAHPTLKSEKTNRPIKVPGAVPDLTEPAIVIPDSVTDLVLLGDSTSDPFITQNAMVRATARFGRPGRVVRVAWAPEGVDFDDLLRAAKGDEAATAAALKQIADIVDAAPVGETAMPAAAGAEEPPIDAATLAQAERKFGNEQMAAGLARLRTIEGDDRLPALSALAEQLGALAAAGAIAEALAKASLEAAVVEIGLIRDLGAKAVKSAIAAGLKLGKKSPADLTEVRRAASAALGAPHVNGRPPVAGDDATFLTASAAPPSSPSGDADDSDQTLASPFASFASSSPRTPLGEEERHDETLANEDEDQGPPDETISDETFRECAWLDQSDVDNGKRLIAYFGRDLMVRQEDDVAAGQMLAWTGTHWDLAGGEALAHLIGQRVGDLIKLEAAYIDASPSEARAINAGDAAAKELKGLGAEVDDPEHAARVDELLALIAAGKKARTALSTRRANRKKWGISTKNAGRIAAMIKCAAPHLRRHPDAFNADPLKVATLTHTLSFVPVMDPENPDPDGKRSLVIDGRVQYQLVAKPGHDREDLLTAVIPFPYKKGATAREFNVFLDLFQPEAKKRRTVQQYSGMSLTAQPVQRVMFHTGTGGNGKSVFLEVLARVFGDGLSVGVPAETVSGVVANNPSAPTPDIARCYAKRYLRIAELPKDAPLKMETIKKLTGGERWPVRTMYKGYFEFKPTAKPHMSGNGEPKFDGSDGGMKRRLAIVEWSVTLPPEKHRDFEDVVSEIVAEGSGILNWLIAGALDFLNNGFILSDDVLQTTAEHFAEMDPVGQFADAHIRPDPGGPGIPARQAYLAYVAWSVTNGKSHMKETRFGLTLKKKFKRDDSGRVHRYVDVALHDVPDNPEIANHSHQQQPSPPNDGYQPPSKHPDDEEI